MCRPCLYNNPMNARKKDFRSKALAAVDGTYFIYFCIFSAVKKWESDSPYAHVLKSAEETDQNNLPDLTKYTDFQKILSNTISFKFSFIEDLIGKAVEELNPDTDKIYKVFSIDSPIKNNWRKKIYPSYKAQRKESKKAFDISKAMMFAKNLICNTFDISQLDYVVTEIKDAEGDDILATVMKDLDGFDTKVLIASDRDFLQLDNVSQYDLFGSKKEILPKLRESDGIALTPKEFLILKILVGDVADNIPKCFSKIGEKKAIKLIKDPRLLREKLEADQIAASQFLLNQKIISFDYIPDSLKDVIVSYVKGRFEELDMIEDKSYDFISSDLMAL